MENKHGTRPETGSGIHSANRCQLKFSTDKKEDLQKMPGARRRGLGRRKG